MSQIGRALFIINPTAQSGRAAQVKENLASYLGHFFDFDIECTSQDMRAKDIAHQAQGYDSIICVGGDGSAHNAANGIMARLPQDRPAFGVIPVGSGNDYARTLGMPMSWRTSAREFHKAVRRRFDIGLANDVYFLESVSFGLDAQIAHHSEELRRSTSATGRLLYFRSGMQIIGQGVQPLDVVIRAQESEETSRRVLMVCATIGKTYGGGFKIAPEGDPTDGYLNIATCEPLGKLEALSLLSRAAIGKHEGAKAIDMYRTRGIDLDFDQRVCGQIDGEAFSGSRFDIQVIAGGIEVLSLL